MTGANWALLRKQPILVRRAEMLWAIRDFFIRRGYLEVETPHRIPANAPEPHIDPVASDGWALHTSPELAMKRMLAAGYKRIFQICRVWREGERGRRHLPEFTMLEWYRVDVDYNSLMEECTELFRHLVPEGKITRQNREIDLATPWEALTVKQAFDRYASMSLDDAMGRDCFEEILTSEVEPCLGKATPTFMIEYPAALAALARTKPGDKRVAERFELYIDGLELANAFSELNDPHEQRRRFTEDETLRRNAGKPPYPMPEKFIDALDDMPQAAGIALGLDRLIMLLCDLEHLDQVVAFTPEEL